MKRTVISLLAAMLVIAGLPAWAMDRPDDQTIQYWVTQALKEDPRVFPLVDVKVDEGIVTLEGSLSDLAARDYALREAKKIEGVRGVIDRLLVEPELRLDADINADIMLRFIESPLPSIRKLDSMVSDGRVLLTGQVPSWSEKQQAELLASEVRGVRMVTNDVLIVPDGTRSDDEILGDIRASLDRDVYVEGLPVRVKVKDGQVTLSGSVGSVYSRERAVADAWVDGVMNVKDDMAVLAFENGGTRKNHPQPADSEIAETVHNELYQDLRIFDPFEINVVCDNGHVTLTGSVNSFWEKTLAARNAGDVVGVAWVTNSLQVSGDRRSDPAIQAGAQRRLESDAMTGGQDVGVQVARGVATLRGSTNTRSERDHAADVVAGVPGVLDVVNHIKVNTDNYYSDSRLQKNIQDRLDFHHQTRAVASGIKVRVRDGIATLEGEVDYWAQRQEAGLVALKTEGILGVSNHLTVDGFSYPWEEWDDVWVMVP